jgi:hypothetical protein
VCIDFNFGDCLKIPAQGSHTTHRLTSRRRGGGALGWGWGGRGHLRIKQPSVPLLVTVSVAVSYSLYLRVFGYLCCNMENITESYVGLLKIVISQRIKT